MTKDEIFKTYERSGLAVPQEKMTNDALIANYMNEVHGDPFHKWVAKYHVSPFKTAKYSDPKQYPRFQAAVSGFEPVYLYFSMRGMRVYVIHDEERDLFNVRCAYTNKNLECERLDCEMDITSEKFKVYEGHIIIKKEESIHPLIKRWLDLNRSQTFESEMFVYGFPLELWKQIDCEGHPITARIIVDDLLDFENGMRFSQRREDVVRVFGETKEVLVGLPVDGAKGSPYTKILADISPNIARSDVSMLPKLSDLGVDFINEMGYVRGLSYIYENPLDKKTVILKQVLEDGVL